MHHYESISKSYVPTNFQMAQPSSHHHLQSITQRLQSITSNINPDVNRTDANSTPPTYNLRSTSSSPNRYSCDATHPQYQPRETEVEVEELYYKYNVLPKNITPSTEIFHQQRHNIRGRQIPLQPQRKERSLSLSKKKEPIEGSRIDDSTNVDDDHQHEVHNYVIDTKTKTLKVYPPPKSLSSVEDQDYNCNDDNSCPMSSTTSSSYVSSLSVDESIYYFSNLAPMVQNPPPVLIICHHSSKIRRGGDEKVFASAQAPHHQKFHQKKSPVRTSSHRIGGNAPNQLMSPSLCKPRESSSENIAQKENYARDMVGSRRGMLKNVSANDLDIKDVVVQRYLEPHTQGSDGRSMDTSCAPSYHRRGISNSTRISIYSRIQQNKQIHSTVPYDYTDFHNSSKINKGSTIKPAKKIASQRTSMSRPPLSTLSLPAILHTRSKSTSAIIPPNKILSQYGNHKRNHSNLAPNQGIEKGSNSITSAGYGSMHQSSIVVNGRVVNSITCRRRSSDTVSFMLGGSGGTRGDGQILHQDFVYKAAIRGVIADLKYSKSIDSKLTNAPNSLESFKNTLNSSQTILVDDTAMRSSGITDSSTNGIVSTSSGVTNERIRRRRRKFLVGTMVPAPLRAMKIVLKKKSDYGFERSMGYLT